MFNIYKVPTGNICVKDGELGKPLEFLSIGDYGKDKNVKADFLGYTKEINGVPSGDILPLSKKWVTTISTQYGCSMGCKFCDVPKVGPGINATFNDLLMQVNESIKLHPEVKTTKRFNLHYARMGEPTWNRNVINSAYYFAKEFKNKKWGFHPVVSTMLPKGNKDLESYIYDWLKFKNKVAGNAGLQLSINTTDESIRKDIMPVSMSLKDISVMMNKVLNKIGSIKGRKITLNFAITEAAIDANLLRSLFDPSYYICKLTPMHKTKSCMSNNLLTKDGYTSFYPYKQIEEDLKKEGFGVIVFVPSFDEDSSLITCGNVILARKELSDEDIKGENVNKYCGIVNALLKNK